MRFSLSLAGLSLSAVVLFVSAPGARGAAEGPRELFNGRDLTGWDTYLGPRYDPQKKEFVGEPVGLNRDPDGVFRVVEIDGAPAIRISGTVWGGVSTIEEFENYHLRLQFKWGEARHAPRANTVRDSGVLYHGVLPHAAGGRFWLRSQELQVQEHDTGDYWAVAGTSIKARVLTEGPNDKPTYLHSPAGPLTVFRSGAATGPRIRRSVDAEHPRGEWNTLDLYCLGQTSLHVVNGVLVMTLHDSEQPDGNGGWTPLVKGRIQLQSEGAEVFYRAIVVEPIERFPDFVLPSKL